MRVGQENVKSQKVNVYITIKDRKTIFMNFFLAGE